MKDIHKKTIRQKLFRSIVIISFSVLMVAGALLSVAMYTSSIRNVNDVMSERNIAVKYFIDGYFAKIFSSIEFLSKIKNVRNRPSGKVKKEVLKLYASLKQVDPDIDFIYSGYQDGSILINDYVVPKDFNSTLRPWYKAALKSNPNISKGVSYRDIVTKEWLISVSKVLVDDKNRVTGVISIDSRVKRIEKTVLQKGNRYKSSFSMVVTNSGDIIIASDRFHIHSNISKVFGENISFKKSSGYMDCYLNGVEKLVYYRRIDNLGWIVLSVIDKNEVLEPILIRILFVILAVTLLIFIFGWMLSISLGRQFITPLSKLRKRVHAIVVNNLNEKDMNPYAKDEIGSIALDIEKLAQSELYNKNIQLKNINEQLEQLSVTDSLTSLFNRRKMNIEIAKEYNRSKRYKTRFSLISFDIDWFKKINDTYGHQAGDAVLRELSKLTRDTVRSTDIVSRWGGEEFLVLCAETDLDTAYNLAQRLRKATQNYKFSVGTTVTISLGVVEFRRKESIDELLKRVDERLYEAKQNGRNRVVM